MSKAMRALIKRVRFPCDVMLTCVRWYLAYALRLRNLEEMMEERGLFVDHSITLTTTSTRINQNMLTGFVDKARYALGRSFL